MTTRTRTMMERTCLPSNLKSAYLFETFEACYWGFLSPGNLRLDYCFHVSVGGPHLFLAL